MAEQGRKVVDNLLNLGKKIPSGGSGGGGRGSIIINAAKVLGGTAALVYLGYNSLFNG